MRKIIGYLDKKSIGYLDDYLVNNKEMNNQSKYPEFSKRLKQVWKECAAAPSNQTQLAKWLGFAQPTVNNWINGNALPSLLTAVGLAEKLGCSTEWLLSGKGQKELTQLSAVATVSPIAKGTIVLGGFDLWDDDTPLDDDEVALPFFREVELSAGSGRHQVIENHGKKLRFAKSTLKKSNVAINKAACVTVSGNSMEPALPNGCVVGIDTNNKSIVDGKPYAIDYHGDLLVKRLYKIPGGGFRLNSFNSEYPDINCSADDASIIIIGKVFWSSQLW